MGTQSHRVMILRGSSQQSSPAVSLEKGDFVICSDSVPRELQEIRSFVMDVIVYEIVFNPDDAVRSFLPPAQTILTKGHTHRTRRAGRNQRPRTKDLASIP